MKWNIGCSGFGYKEWRGIFYPDKMAATKWLNFYTNYFNSVELNNTFYRFPTEKRLLDWYIKSPDNFSFACKVPKLITHFKQMNSTDQLLKDFYSTCKTGYKKS